MIQISQK